MKAGYSARPFRPSVVVEATSGAWSEESWQELITGDRSILLRRLKECPRCTVPCRDQDSGQFYFKDDALKATKALRKLRPQKADDPEWKSWTGPFFGVYFAHSSAGLELSVGTALNLEKRRKGGRVSAPHLRLMITAIAVLLVLATAAFSYMR